MSSARINRSWGPNPPYQQITADHSSGPLDLPLFTPDAIAYLKSVFTVKVGADLSLRDYDRMVGQQDVLRHIQEISEALQSKD